MRAVMIGAAAAILAACAPMAQGSLRDPSVQIASAALFDPSRFTGDWYVVAAYGHEASCGDLRETWRAKAEGGFSVAGTACGPRGLSALSTEAQLVGPGRIARSGPNGNETLWVLWVDADYRIAAIGTPDGSFGRIIARTKEPRTDLINAAREVLEFNGYDLAGLQMI